MRGRSLLRLGGSCVDQLTFFPKVLIAGCGNCICKGCLLGRSGRCPHGSCFDDKRAKENPYDKAHPGDPPRKLWSNWKTDQAYWCRGGTCYPAYQCEEYIQYQGSKVHSCLEANVQVYQDGYISCSLLYCGGCEECYERFEERLEAKG